ncbi:hypothetical protein [Arthrobacter sp. ZGTC412]|uniref:hypothetical protein n=1 Tax=Arthrobacter sp. ZGTC412 TaxID=2058900 RepID=UPI0021587346|nr:hypothetical protein [Arthrobacter sp. ZGTC412]
MPLVDARATPTPAAAPTVPVPQPQAPPPTETAVPPPASATQGGAPAAPAVTAPGGTATAPAPEVPASEDPLPSASAPSGKAAGLQTVTAFYVLLDDGGSNGVRFGCNDSLVGVAHISSAGEDALAAAVRALLDAQAEAVESPPPSPDVYNALSGSELKFLSGSFDGTTVTVYLAGTLSMGGVCDLPRVEAQLTQTAVSAVGAIRAEIYVNGRSLSEALQLN